MARLLTYNYFINKYIFNNQICKYNNHIPHTKKSFTFNNTDDVKSFIHYHHVKNHDFGDLSLADEITINDGTYNRTWLIAGFNTQLDSDVKNGTFNKHHLILIPKDYLFTKTKAQFHNVDSNSKGFARTKMFNKILPEINNNLSSILQEHLLEHKMMLSFNNKNKMKSFTVKTMLLNYYQAFGIELPYQYYYSTSWNNNNVYLPSSNKYINNDFDNGDDMFQLPLFKQDVKYRTINKYWWLRNAYSMFCYAGVDDYGKADYFVISDVTNNVMIRPFICLG